MSFLFGNLVAIRRGKEMFYCFLEARLKLFSSIDENHINYAMNFLGINTLSCTEPELLFLETTLPSQFAPFNLLSEQNLLRLHRLLVDFRQVESKTPIFDIQFPSGTNDQAGFSPVMLSEPLRVQRRFKSGNYGDKSPENHSAQRQESFYGVDASKRRVQNLESGVPDDEIKRNEIGESSSDYKVENAVSNPSSSALEIPAICDDSRGESKISTDVSDEKKNRKPGGTLTEAEMSPRLRSEICEVRKFYSVQLNCDREGSALQNTTIDKMIERTCGFLWFLKNVKSVEPALVHCANPQFVQEYVHFMMNKRGIKPITCSRYITAFINVSKVPLDSYGSSDKDESSESLEKIRAVQRQLERLARRERVEELAKKPQLEKVVYGELLELCRELKWEVEEKSGSDQARSCMHLCLLLLYCAANPGRAKEYVTLRIYKNQNEDQAKNQNFICFNEDGTVILFEDDYKTRNTYGPNRTDLSQLTFLTYYLKMYCTKMRPLLLCGKEHDYFFVNPRGDPFSQASYGNYISALFEKYFSLKLTTVDIRKAVVNHFLTLPQSSDYSLRESFATLMKHSVRAQKRYYDERPLAHKKLKALDLLGSVASRSLGEGSIDVLSDEDDELNIDLLPAEGEFVALVAANSTNSIPEVFVAKVLRLSDDRKIAYLAEFSETEPGKFKLNAGKSYRESVSALIYPIDIVYLHSNGVYELRTPKLEIHHQVYKK